MPPRTFPATNRPGTLILGSADNLRSIAAPVPILRTSWRAACFHRPCRKPGSCAEEPGVLFEVRDPCGGAEHNPKWLALCRTENRIETELRMLFALFPQRHGCHY